MEIKKAFGKKNNIGDLDNMSEEVSYNTELLTSYPLIYSTSAAGFLTDSLTVSLFFWMIFWIPSSI